MHAILVFRIVGLLLMMYSLSLLPPIAVALYYDESSSSLHAFGVTFICMFLLGAVLWFRRSQSFRLLQARDGFIITVAFWFVLSGVSALPFLLHHDGLSLSRAVFEAVSGFTTTGATVYTDIDTLAKSLLYYRQQLQFLGGLGVIVLAIAILPILGVGGYQLYRAEAPGPMSDDKITPRLAQTAKVLVGLYMGLTVLCAWAFWLAGMTPFDAIAHSYTTVSTSGFSTHNASMGYFSDISPWIEWIAILFMILGSLNFTLHYLALHHFTLKVYWQDIQARVFMGFVLLLVFLTMLGLLFYEITDEFGVSRPVTDNIWDAFRFASFQIVSIISTTGYTTENFSAWPPVLAVLVFSSGFIGGCVGSTAGGFKIIRIILLYKQGLREIHRLIHPSAVNTMRIQGKAVSERVIQTVLGFTFLYFSSYVLLSIALLAVTDLSAFDAFTAMAACINTIGPGLGEVANNFATVSDFGLWLCSFAMILGRLEIFALLVVLMPAFWRQ